MPRGARARARARGGRGRGSSEGSPPPEDAPASLGRARRQGLSAVPTAPRSGAGRRRRAASVATGEDGGSSPRSGRSPTPPPSGHVSEHASEQDEQQSEAGSERAEDRVDASQTVPKKKKRNFPLPRDVEEVMVEWVRETEVLWNSKKHNYHNTAIKTGLWHDKGQELGYTGEHLRGWWTGMRDNYTRLHHPKSGQAAPNPTDRQQWILANLHFLQAVVRHRAEPVRPVSFSFISKQIN